MTQDYTDVKDHVSYDTIDHVTAISDPGERDRDLHLWGDRLMINLGNVAAWLFPILMVAIVTQVFMRKAGHNMAWLDDAQWWLYGSALLTGFGYAITTNSHVRVDILHSHYSDKKKARIELFALGWCLIPFLIMMTDILIHYAYASWVAGEGSDSPNGLHGLYMLKMLLPALFMAAIIASSTVLHRNLAVLGKPALWSLFLAAFPAVWFAAERGAYYLLWWITHLSNPELKIRRVSKEPLLQGTVWYGLAIVLVLIVASFLLSRRNSSKA
ncbi:MAG: TRAP transporter small permease subunit [Rhodobacteraceae bacterium]|nr:TRAP transporter small permease subunit [Paracoccaceae bacterium]